ncbi:MAG: hypothetical protein RIC80_06160 [Cyclobacteriaceae bacterium]
MISSIFKTLYWVTFATAIVAFWVSIRTEEDQLMYTLFALLIWGIAYFFHWLEKRYRQEE